MFASPGEAVVHTLAVVMSVAVLGISVLAYRKRRERRYLFLTIAFVFLALGQGEEFVESFYFDSFILIPYLQIHVSHFLDLAMLVCFGLALLR